MNFIGNVFVSGGGLAIQGEQIVPYGGKSSPMGVLRLNGGSLTSYALDLSSDSGFVQNGVADNIIDAANSVVLGDDEIVEIAGGDAVKLRYKSGTCVVVVGPELESPSVIVHDDVARVTSNGIYYGSKNYYKSGPGDAPLVPYLSKVHNDKNANIVAVFEGNDSDKIVTIDDMTAGTDPVVGALGDMLVTEGAGGMVIHTQSGEIQIDGYGLLMRRNDPVHGFVQQKVVQHGTDPASINWDEGHCPAQRQYNESHSSTWQSGWMGVGRTGHIINLGESFYREVAASASSPSLADEIPVVIQGGSLKRIGSDGSLSDLQSTNIAGAELVEFVFSHNMADYHAVASGLKEIEPFCVNGFSFGYGGGRWVNATLQNLT
jgi:hypothetical protein